MSGLLTEIIFTIIHYKTWTWHYTLWSYEDDCIQPPKPCLVIKGCVIVSIINAC